MELIGPLIFILAIVLIFYPYKRLLYRHNKKFIENYQFPQRLYETLGQKYPHLDNTQIDLVIEGLKEYFHVCGMAKTRMVAMPSQVVDVVWHDFILFTKKYDEFCKKAFGKFLHHTPVETMTTKTSAQDSLKRVWELSCKREGINPRVPDKLPLLFALDTDLVIEDGFKYSLDCKSKQSDSSINSYCVSDIGSTSDYGCSGYSGDSTISCSSCSSCGGGGD
jgi:hypothetical protein